MDSPQSVVSPFKNSSVFAETEKTADLFNNGLGFMSGGVSGQIKDNKGDDSIGKLQVFVHRARDIHNICIYHKQDVYAKLCLTSDPENFASTKIINGGGQNPVFNDTVELNVRTLDTSLKCEIWMLSRVRNYLEDQLLGFALVPLSEIVVDNGKHEKEFSLSSTDLFHSPAGYVQLSIAYNGSLPEVMVMSSFPASTIADEGEEAPGSFELEKIEFPDPDIIKEEQLMVSECFGVPYSDLISRSSDSFSSDTENQITSEAGVQLVESFSAITTSTKHDSPYDSYSSETPRASSKSPSKDDYNSPSKETHKEKSADFSDTKSITSGNESGGTFVKPVITVNLEQEQQVVQQDIVDMYMKSMQQFTESLAKMKLPLDIDNNPTLSGDSTTDRKQQGSNNSGNRVFYGSRAFF